MIKTVYLDVDGVLANFYKRAFEVLGLKYDYNHPVLKKWGFYEDFNLTFEELDSICTIDFWAGLQWMPDGRDILKLVESYFNNIYLLTTPMPNPGSWTGKKLWTERHLPEYSKRLIITQADKSLFVNSESLLIDDRYKNCVRFQNAGGYAILVPRPWNDGGPTLNHIKDSLEVLCQES